MLPRKNFNSPVDSSKNDSTNSSPINPELDSPKIPENSKDLLSPTDKVESSELLTDTSKKKKRGFSVFGCLTIILGIFTWDFLFLPSVLSCGNQAKQTEDRTSEARTYIGSMNRAQQAYFLENDTFSNSIARLGLGIATQTVNYQYSIRTTKNSAFNYGIPRRTDNNLKGYVGGVFVVPLTTVNPKADKKEMTTLSILCEAISPGRVKLAEPILKKSIPTCSPGTRDL